MIAILIQKMKTSLECCCKVQNTYKAKITFMSTGCMYDLENENKIDLSRYEMTSFLNMFKLKLHINA